MCWLEIQRFFPNGRTPGLFGDFRGLNGETRRADGEPATAVCARMESGRGRNGFDGIELKWRGVPGSELP